MWLAMGLNLPLSLLFWHAPALVHWHGVPPVKALFFSFVACIRNLGAYLVFGLIFGVFMVVIVLTISIVTAIASVEAAAAAMMPSVMLVMALFFSSLYFTFADSFVATPDEAPKQEV